MCLGLYYTDFRIEVSRLANWHLEDSASYLVRPSRSPPPPIHHPMEVLSCR